MPDKDLLVTTALPAIEEPKEETSLRDADANEATPAQRPLILVVDDAADNVAMLSLDLQNQGYRVVTATNGEEAVAVASYARPDLILMDISMPRLDGLGATRKIRETPALRAIPIVALTAFGTEGFQRAAYDAGVSGYLTKPVDFDRMHQLIIRLLVPGGSGNLSA